MTVPGLWYLVHLLHSSLGGGSVLCSKMGITPTAQSEGGGLRISSQPTPQGLQCTPMAAPAQSLAFCWAVVYTPKTQQADL